MEKKISLRYVGSAVEAGNMDVYDVASNMVAFSEFAMLSAKALYGSEAKVSADVAGFGRGSFVTDILVSVAVPALNLLSVIAPADLWTVVRESIEVWKHLKGEPPKEVVAISNNTVAVTNNSGQVIQVQNATFNVVVSEKGSDTVQKFVKGALSKDGLDSVQLGAENEDTVSVSKHESRFFIPVTAEESIVDHVLRMGLIVESPTFKSDLKWRFFDGQNSFHAEILDKEFLERVDAGERFGKGDVLRADVQIKQVQRGMSLAVERRVLKVVEHKVAPQQMSLLQGPSG